MGKVKLSVLTDDIILYRENPQELTDELLELINQFRYFVGYKINLIK